MWGFPRRFIVTTEDGVKTHWVAVPFFVKVDPRKVKNNEPEKIDEIKWFTLDALPKPLHTGFQFTLGEFKERFENYK